MILQQLTKYPKSTRLVLLIRHADRDEIPDGTFGDEIELNELGLQKSRIFGTRLRSLPVSKVITSPVQRCIQTGVQIALAFDKKLPVSQSNALGNPGLHISDAKAAGKAYFKYGTLAMYDRYIKRLPVAGVQEPTLLLSDFNKFSIENASPSGITIFVTHDMLVANYHFALDGSTYSRDNWIAYLNGLVIPIAN